MNTPLYTQESLDLIANNLDNKKYSYSILLVYGTEIHDEYGFIYKIYVTSKDTNNIMAIALLESDEQLFEFIETELLEK